MTNEDSNAQWPSLCNVLLHRPGRSSAYGSVESPLRLTILWYDSLALCPSLRNEGVKLSERFEAMAEVNIRTPRPFSCTKQGAGA